MALCSNNQKCLVNLLNRDRFSFLYFFTKISKKKQFPNVEQNEKDVMFVSRLFLIIFFFQSFAK